jgi:hypothetical protein
MKGSASAQTTTHNNTHTMWNHYIWDQHATTHKHTHTHTHTHTYTRTHWNTKQLFCFNVLLVGCCFLFKICFVSEAQMKPCPRIQSQDPIESTSFNKKKARPSCHRFRHTRTAGPIKTLRNTSQAHTRKQATAQWQHSAQRWAGVAPPPR